MIERISWNEYWMNMAYLVASRSTCVRRQVGCVIVSKDNRVLSTGYNGAPSKVTHCLDLGCPRRNLPSGEGLDICIGGHAETNAISNAAKYGISLKDSIMYSVLKPCQECLKSIINAGIKKVYYVEDYNVGKTYNRIVNESRIILEEIKA